MIGVTLAAVAVLVGAVLLANELVLLLRYDGDAPPLRDRLHHGRHARGWVLARRMWDGLNDAFGPPFVSIEKGHGHG